MEQPEPEPRHGVVIARVTAIQKTKQMFVEKVEPEKAVVRAGFAMDREIEVRRIPQGGKHMPGRGNRQEKQATR